MSYQSSSRTYVSPFSLTNDEKKQYKSYLQNRKKTRHNVGCYTHGHVSPCVTGSAIMTPGPISNCSYGGVPWGGYYDDSFY